MRNNVWTLGVIVASGWLSGCLSIDRAFDLVHDYDQDGYYSEGGGYGDDCDDDDPAVNPGIPESCGDGIDNDCDGEIDEWGENGTFFYADADGDGYGDALVVEVFCFAPDEGWAELPGDCDDANSLANPGAEEACNGFDDDCNGEIDEAGEPFTYVRDADGDGFGSPSDPVVQCAPPAGYILDAGLADCDDDDAAAYPGAAEVWYDGINQDCDPTTEWDQDADGVPDARIETVGGLTQPVGTQFDCDDTNAQISPLLDEVWYDGIDQDCNPATEWDRDGDGLLPFGAPDTSFEASDCDDATPVITTPNLYFLDADGDGYGDALTVPTVACLPPGLGYVQLPGDCNDQADGIHPGRPELCNLLDDNCDGQVDNGVGVPHWPDGDADGHGNADLPPVVQCFETPGYVNTDDDCNDADATIRPSAVEVCDGLDQDCDGVPDDGVTLVAWPDLDQDGHGDASGAPMALCAIQATTADNADDCDDTNPMVRPNAPEVCDGIDQDCDGVPDDGVTISAWTDADQDGHGEAGSEALTVCALSPGLASIADDCNDADATVRPSAPEVCDGVDQDCDGLPDDGVTVVAWPDADGDGTGDATADFVNVCAYGPGLVNDNTDCDDTNAAVLPGRSESCDGLDNDCDSFIDEGAQVAVWPDSDGDGKGASNQTLQFVCTVPAGFVTNGDDCNDTESAVFIGAAEVCDGLDNDCDTQTDEGLLTPSFADFDGDGHGSGAMALVCAAPGGGPVSGAPIGDDCNDTDATAFPGATEVCDGVDNNCDTQTDEGLLTGSYTDNDGDGYGNGAVTLVCEATTGGPITGAAVAGDCNDADAAVFPGAVEVCDGVDNNCDGSTADEDRIASWPDADGDGAGDDSFSATLVCKDALGAPVVGSANNDDCDDADATTYAGAPEVCDGVDNNCVAGIADEARVQSWPDADSDGQGQALATPTLVCTNASGEPVSGVANNDDCDDTSDTTYVGAPEICDGVDNNCVASTTDEARVPSWPDADGDGRGDQLALPSLVCTDATGSPVSGVANSDDCDDVSATTYDGAPELCDGIDNDCDGTATDEDRVPSWPDADGDGYGNAVAFATLVCKDPSGAPVSGVANDDDCDDASATTYPLATEVCDGVDNNCDGSTADEQRVLSWPDADGDGQGSAGALATLVCVGPTGVPVSGVSNSTDCNDADPTAFFGATEVCDGIDNNCNAQLDEGLTVQAWPDGDGDGFGDAAGLSSVVCRDPSTSLPVTGAANNTDCNDADATISPAATEVCDGIDDNCNGDIDDDLDVLTWPDLDGDGRGDDSTFALALCPDATGALPQDVATNDDDCDDTDALVFAGADEFCDGFDNDCDTFTDEFVTTDFFVDADGDGFGTLFDNAGVFLPPVEACTAPNGGVGWSTFATDCDDDQPLANPSRGETSDADCDSIDNDCDGVVDEGLIQTWYRDADGDGWGGLGNGETVCVADLSPAFDWVLQAGDCAKDDPSIFPGASEFCDGVDNNCNSLIDEGVTQPHWPDADGDGQGDAGATSTDICPFSAAAAGLATNNVDCDDSTNLVFQNRPETCDGLDNDCNGLVDDGNVLVEWFPDNDGDGFGSDFAFPEMDCEFNPIYGAAGGDYVKDDSDCDDADNARNPGELEICNAIDDDCDGTRDGANACAAVALDYAELSGKGFMLLRDPVSITVPRLANFFQAESLCSTYGYRLPQVTFESTAEMELLTCGSGAPGTTFACGQYKPWLGIEGIACASSYYAGGAPGDAWAYINDPDGCDAPAPGLAGVLHPLTSINAGIPATPGLSLIAEYIGSPSSPPPVYNSGFSHATKNPTLGGVTWCELP